jgi:hypothetical protein
MSDTGVRFKEEFSPFRIIVVALLTIIAVLQFLTLESDAFCELQGSAHR